MHNRSKKQITPNSNTNYRREIKLIPFNMDYCLLQFNALIFFLGHLSIWGGGIYLTLIFSMSLIKFNKRKCEIAWTQIFTTFLALI